MLLVLAGVKKEVGGVVALGAALQQVCGMEDGLGGLSVV
jgi:hypothetical protein